MSWLPGGSGPVLTYIGSSNHINQIGSLFAGYDSAGNMTSDGTHTYEYDGEGRMTTVVQGGSTYQTNTYNSLGQLVEADFPGFNAKVLSTFDASGRELGQYNGVGGYWWDQDVRAGGRMLAQEQTGAAYFLHANTLGSDTQLTNQAGTVLMDMLYYPWGEVWQTAGSTVDSHFAGFQKSAGPIFQTPNRSYLGSLGRWMTPDPLGGDVTNPQSLNRYAYVTNSPATLTDPLGLYNPFECDPLDPIDCGPPSCYFGDPGDCPPCDPVFGCPPPPPGGGGRGGSSGGTGGGAPPSAPPAGQPPLTGQADFLGLPPCVDESLLKLPLVIGLNRALHPVNPITVDQVTFLGVQGGASQFEINNGGKPIELAQPVQSQNAKYDVYHQDAQQETLQRQIHSPQPKDQVPGVGKILHALFNPGAPDPQTGLPTITDLQGHFDYGTGAKHSYDLSVAPFASFIQGCQNGGVKYQ